MTEKNLTIPEIALIAGTRVALGAGTFTIPPMWEHIFNAPERTDQRNIRIRFEATRKPESPMARLSRRLA
jgi:hypothetical protein